MRNNLWDDPRVGRLCDLCGCVEAPIIGGLYWLWATADQHTEDGILPGLSLRQIDRKSGVPGFGQAMCDIGWLAEDVNGVRILRFEEHNGTSAKKRAVTAKRVANHRFGNADVTLPALQDEHGSVSGALAREREEERNTVPNGTGASAPPPIPPAGQGLDGSREPDAIWDVGVQYLVAHGATERGARGFLGKMRKELNDDLVAAELIAEAQRKAVSEPIAWLRKAAHQRISDGRSGASGVAL